MYRMLNISKLMILSSYDLRHHATRLKALVTNPFKGFLGVTADTAPYQAESRPDPHQRISIPWWGADGPTESGDHRDERVRSIQGCRRPED